jgi:DeoR family fructose operon transcriptional repressor
MSIDTLARIDRIRSSLLATGRVRVGDLALEFGVSEMTIRRDLDVMAEQGLVHRVRGGAIALGPQPFADRYGRQARAKDKIADKLVGLVRDGGAIAIDASTTMQRLAGRLDHTRDITVVTNSWESFAVLDSHPGVTALLTGGRLDPRTGSLVGPLATRAARDIALRTLFVSAAGIDPQHGTTETTLEEAEVKQALGEESAQIVVAVDSTKLDQRAAARCIPLAWINVLVTDLAPDDARLDPYREHCDVR